MTNELTTREATTVEIRCDKLRFPRIIAVPRVTAEAGIRQALVEAAALRGQSFAPEALRFTCSALLDELLRDTDGIGLKYITLEEIRRETRAAALGNRGEIYGLNVASIYRVLRDYTLGAGHEAEVEARRRARATMDKAIAETPVGAAITSATGKVLNAINARKI